MKKRPSPRVKKSKPRKQAARRRTEVTRTVSKTIVRKTRRNPAVSLDRQVKDAVERYAGFRGAKPESVSKVRMRDQPRVLLTVGECLGILYRTDRDGVVDNYIHRFKKHARPTLCCTSDGRQLYMLGGAYKMTERGIVDASK